MKLPVVSVIVPIYRVEKYIGRCIATIISQTYKNIELILVDDCGNDNSLAIAISLLEKEKYVYNVVRHDRNRGLSVARNSGIGIATGEYLFFMDSDDELPSDAIGLLVNSAIYNRADVVQGGLSWVEGINCKTIANHSDTLVGNRNILRYIVKNGVLLIGCNKLINRKFLINNNLFFFPDILHEDLLWSFLLFSKLTSLSFVEDTTYLYMIRSNSITTAPFSQKKMDSFELIIEKMKIILYNNNARCLFSLYLSRCFSILEITLESNNREYVNILRKAIWDTQLNKRFLWSLFDVKNIFKIMPFVLPFILIKPYLKLISIIR